MKKHIVNIKRLVKDNKKKSIFLGIIILLIIYYTYSSLSGSTTQNQYYLGTVKTGNIYSTVTGTGQISTSNQIDLKSKVTAEVINIPVKEGDEVKAGQTIIQLDSRNAEIALQSARLAYQKLVKPADTVTLLQTQNALESAKDANKKAYGDGYTSVVSTFIDSPTIMNGLDSMLNGGGGFLSDEKTYSTTESQFRNNAKISYIRAKTRYDIVLETYKKLNTNTPKDDVEKIVNESYLVAKDIAQALKDAKSAADYLKQNGSSQNQSGASTAISDLISWSSTITTDLNSLTNAKDDISSTKLDLNEKNEALLKLERGADTLDIQTEALNLRQKEYDYQNYFVKAPFDGIVAKINVKKGDTASGAVVTFTTKNQIATVSLNEVDAAKVSVGQKVKLSFDAINDLFIDGIVTKIDLVGTMNQGVVTYGVEITLDNQDPRIKPGMSVSAEIITNTKENVLTIPNSAIKTKGKVSYVETFDKQYPATTKGGSPVISSTLPRQQNIEIGITNDTETEVLSGLKLDDIIVIRTTTGTAVKKATPSAANIFGGQRGAQSGSVRVGR
jgi:HlyD family secretion protein